MRYLTVLIAAVSLYPMSAIAADEGVSPEQFASATSTCFKALGAEAPSKVLTVVEADGWRLRQTTPLGGIFVQAGNSIDLKIEAILTSRVCTVLGNRDHKVPLLDLSQLIEVRLKERFQDKVQRDETKADYSLIVDGKFLAVITPMISGNSVNTQITTIEKYVSKKLPAAKTEGN